MDNSPLDPRIDITEAKALLNAAWNTTSDERYNQLIEWARDLLKPHVEANIPEALWLSCSMPQENTEQISDEEFHRKHMIEVRAAAEAGSASAKFFLACQLDHEPTFEESTTLFREAAEQGHTYSKWCYGLNLLSGRGTEKNEELGLRFIQEAGQEKFEGAIQFLSNAYANGTYGFTKDEGVAATWWAKFKDEGVIRY
jgi:TPR repeat protein